MAHISLLKTPFGELKIDFDFVDEIVNSSESRTITFNEGALTISGLNIRSIVYYHIKQPLNRQSPLDIRDFEQYLLDRSHSFEHDDVKNFVNKFGLSGKYSESLTINFFLKDSPSMWFSILLGNNDIGDKAFKLDVFKSTDYLKFGSKIAVPPMNTGLQRFLCMAQQDFFAVGPKNF